MHGNLTFAGFVIEIMVYRVREKLIGVFNAIGQFRERKKIGFTVIQAL